MIDGSGEKENIGWKTNGKQDKITLGFEKMRKNSRISNLLLLKSICSKMA